MCILERDRAIAGRRRKFKRDRVFRMARSSRGKEFLPAPPVLGFTSAKVGRPDGAHLEPLPFRKPGADTDHDADSWRDPLPSA